MTPKECTECGLPTDDPSGVCEACQEEIVLAEQEELELEDEESEDER